MRERRMINELYIESSGEMKLGLLWKWKPYKWMNGWMNEWMNAWIDGCMHRWMNV